jgi:hypothetical protein
MRRLTVAKAANGEPKKPYSTPELTVYGKVTELTQAHTAGNFSDNGRHPFSKGTRLG